MSGRHNFLNKFKIQTAGSQTGTTTVTSSITNIQALDNVGIQVNVLTGTANGTFDVQVSADHQEVNGIVTVAGNWIKLGTPYAAVVAAGVFTDGTSTCYFDLTQLSAPFVRLSYTNTSGTGTYDAFIVAKMI